MKRYRPGLEESRRHTVRDRHHCTRKFLQVCRQTSTSLHQAACIDNFFNFVGRRHEMRFVTTPGSSA